jgi:Ser/Thr protein kinase RdoA (MazF antagonist)
MHAGEQAAISLHVRPDGAREVHKRYHAAAGYLRERDALLGLAEAAFEAAPTLLGHDDTSRTLRLSFVPGVSPAQLPPVARARAWASVGAALALLPGLPPPGDPMPLADAMARRARAWTDRLRTPLPPALAAVLADADAFRGAERRLCHRDLRDDNVRVRPDGTVVLLDWGQARPDAEESDLCRLARAAEDDEPGAAADLAALCAGLGYDRHDTLRARRLAFTVALERVAAAVTATGPAPR